MTIRMLATDLDGTLLRSDSSVSARNRTAIRRAADAGLLVVFVTGRPPRWLHEISDVTGHTGVAVAANGAVLYDLANETVLGQHLLQPAELGELTTKLRLAFPDVMFAVEYGLSFAHEPGYTHYWEINPVDRLRSSVADPFVGSLAQVISRPGVKLLAKHHEADPDDFLREASELLAGRATVTHSSSFGLLEIAAAGITKATGLAELAGSQGIGAHEVAAIGDMPNDIPMLAWAGESYAVANAHRDVLAIAQHVLASNDDDAVADLIDTLLLRL
jgi:Cof subfamily protein (haloacid dehalogenase superfamily)